MEMSKTFGLEQKTLTAVTDAGSNFVASLKKQNLLESIA